QATEKNPRVGANEQVRTSASAVVVVSDPEITAATRPEPVSAMADSVAGPSGLMPAAVVSGALPVRRGSRLSRCTVRGGFCVAVGVVVPRAGKTKPGWPGAGPGGGSSAGPATASAVPAESEDAPMQPLPMVGYRNCEITGPSAGG